MIKLVLIRHGQSEWNKAGIFTGWTDVNLSEEGRQEAKLAGEVLKNAGYSFDIAYTSYLKRAIHTLWIILEQMDLMWIPVVKDWHLNERHYGDLQGQVKEVVKKEVGVGMFKQYRRSYSTRPPQMAEDDVRSPDREAKYSALPEGVLPHGESLEDALNRFKGYWESNIMPVVKDHKNVLISAHGNSLRALIMLLEDLDENQIASLELPTGNPLVYELKDDLSVVSKKYMLPLE
ncbi:MAG: 2,3-diphosphoglycerate-dependent phosphoglycerate mutase [Candidatus Cloacimonetes bacterium]|nr:2,3-diphosphoglycerate-dependent phosphoglycerate mutase [Candidatus Cloacimonadota bacterium]